MKATFWTRTDISSRLFTIHFSRFTRWVRSQGLRSNFEITEARFFIPVISENELFIYTESYVNLIETFITKLVFLAVLWVQRRPTAVDSDSFEPTSWSIKAVRAREATDDDGAKVKRAKVQKRAGFALGWVRLCFDRSISVDLRMVKNIFLSTHWYFSKFYFQSNSQYVFTLNFTLQRQRFRRDCFFFEV